MAADDPGGGPLVVVLGRRGAARRRPADRRGPAAGARGGAGARSWPRWSTRCGSPRLGRPGARGDRRAGRGRGDAAGRAGGRGGRGSPGGLARGGRPGRPGRRRAGAGRRPGRGARPRQPALVLCGDRSADRGTGALPAFLAHELGAAQALGLVSLALPGDAPRPAAAEAGLAQEAGGLGLVGERRLPGGWRERLWIGLPAVCSVEAAGVSLRRAPLDAMLASRRAAVPVARPHAGPGTPVIAGPPRPYRPRTHEVPPAPAGSARERLAELSGVLVQRPADAARPGKPGRSRPRAARLPAEAGCYPGRLVTPAAGQSHASRWSRRWLIPRPGRRWPGQPEWASRKSGREAT